MNPDHIAAALMIGGALAWFASGWLLDLRLRAEAERGDAENQARWDFERHVLDALRAAADEGLIEPPRSATPIFEDLAVERLRAELDQWGTR
jgi:hypothetical protein